MATCGPSTMPRTVQCLRTGIGYDAPLQLDATGMLARGVGAIAGRAEGKVAIAGDEVCLEGASAQDAASAEARPAETGECFSTAQCEYDWKLSAWSDCAPACGASSQKRSVACRGRNGGEAPSESMCTLGKHGGKRPVATRACANYDTCSYAWHVGNDVPTCSDGEQNAGEDGVDCGGPCPACAVDGGWSDYDEWSECSQKCGPGFMTAARTCTNPAPSAGGKSCEGAAEQKQPCVGNPECRLDFGADCDYVSLSTPSSFTLKLEPGQTSEIVQLEPGKSHVFVRVSSLSGIDVDIGLEDDSSPPKAMISYAGPLHWGDSQFTEGGMNIKGCTDDCDDDLVVKYLGDGQEHTLQASKSANSEYIYIDKVLATMHITAQAYSAGTVQVEYSFDCSEECAANAGCSRKVPESGASALVIEP